MRQPRSKACPARAGHVYCRLTDRASAPEAAWRPAAEAIAAQGVNELGPGLGATRKPQVIYFGRVIEHYRIGVYETVHAMPAILREVPGAKLVLIGDGPNREPLKALAARLGRADAVRYALAH